MRRMLLPLLLLAACGSTEERPARTVEEPGTVVAEADLDVGRSAEAGSPPALLLELRPRGEAPRRLSVDLAAGRTWLRVERPRGFSFAAFDLIEKEGPFRPSSALLVFVQPREGAAPVAEPALLRLAGRVDAAAVMSRVETIDEPPEDGDELARIESANLRVLLGRGLDVLLACAGSGELDTHHWISVTDGEGRPAEWRQALADARAGAGLEALAPYRALVRRRRPGDPVPAHFRVRLDDVIVAAQARLEPRGESLDWIWEGVWSARLDAPAPEGPPAWPSGAPPLEVRYKEYVQPSGGTRPLWQGLLAPLVFGADVGMAILEGEGPLVDSVAERQRRRD